MAAIGRADALVRGGLVGWVVVSRLTVSGYVDADTAAAVLAPRDDLVGEIVIGEGHFGLGTGPFERYERRVTLVPAGDGFTVTEHFDFRLATPFWRGLFIWPVRRQLRRRVTPGGAQPWWAPPDRFDAIVARTLSALAVLSVVAGYLGTVISQTLTFAADEFGNDRGDQGLLLAAIRVGTPITVVLGALADRRGRRRLLLVSALGGITATMLGAASLGLWSLGVTQAVARGFSAGLALLVGILSAEIVPARSRAYAASVLTLAAGLGSGMVVWILRLADLGEAAWRLIYLVPTVGLGAAVVAVRHVSEPPRVARVLSAGRPAAAIERNRWVMLAVVSFLVLAFAAPASQYNNEFLRDERGFSAGELSLFTVVTMTPISVGVAVAGRLADTRGRRLLGAGAVAFAAVCLTLRYASAGAPMWLFALVGNMVGAASGPVLGVYQAELFATSARGRANGWLSFAAVAGSSTGVLAVGFLADRLDSFAQAFAVMLPLPLIAALVVLARYPETAGRELESLNPD